MSQSPLVYAAKECTETAKTPDQKPLPALATARPHNQARPLPQGRSAGVRRTSMMAIATADVSGTVAIPY